MMKIVSLEPFLLVTGCILVLKMTLKLLSFVSISKFKIARLTTFKKDVITLWAPLFREVNCFYNLHFYFKVSNFTKLA
jgi:hypothetical protein